MTKEEVSRFRTAIKRDYYLQMYYDDDLPIWEFVGEVHKQGILDNYKYFLHTHICFDVLFNKDCVIEIKVHVHPVAVYTGAAVDLTKDKETFVKFVYSVFWKEVDIPFEKKKGKVLTIFNGTALRATPLVFSVELMCYPSLVHWFPSDITCVSLGRI